MALLITKLLFGEVHTIPIPTDAIFIISLLIVFPLIGYLFNNILNNETNQLGDKNDIDSDLELVKKKLEDQFTFEVKTLDAKTEENKSNKKLNLLPSSNLLGFGSLALLAMGGTSLIGLQHMQKSYGGVKTSQANIKLVNQSIKSTLSIIDSKPLDKNQSNIQEIIYIDPSLSTIKSSKENHYYQFKEKQIDNNFSF